MVETLTVSAAKAEARPIANEVSDIDEAARLRFRQFCRKRIAGRRLAA
jgi:hypothetical protein